MQIPLPKAFEPLAHSLTRLDKPSPIYWIFYSGRGTGKSENIAALLVLAMYMNPGTRVACIREVQHSISESVKATLEKWVSNFGLDKYFHITGSSLSCNNGSECFFLGLKNSNSPNIKSIANISITFIEEASQLSEKSWRLLVPSVTRVKNPRIIAAFNPDREDDVIYKEFVANTPPKNSVVKRLTWEDNPFFANSSLYQVMLDDKERLPREVFAHIWEGELAKNVEDSLFKRANFDVLEADEYLEEVVIGVDPATTNSDFSNEYGIVVAGITKKQGVRILGDYTAHYTPREFASKVVELYYEFKADTVIVETNQGGDFIKSAILDVDPRVYIKEVRAGTSKQARALPVANMMELGTLRFKTPCPKLRRQMELTTLRGYLGPRGESPDALDACIWAVYHLMGIGERDSIYKVFDPNMFNKKINDDGYVIQSKLVIYANGDTKIACYAINNIESKQLVICDAEPYDGFYDVIRPDTMSNSNLERTRTYVKENKKLEETVAGLIDFFKTNQVFIKDGRRLLNALAAYTYDVKRDSDAYVDLFCDIIIQEYNLI